VTLRVNFPRRFDPALQKTRQKQSGRPQKVVMRYGKGLTNYGSHLVDFLIDWFGAVTEVQAFGPDPGPEGALTFCCRMAAGFDAVIVGIGGLDYDQFEIDMFYPDRRVEFAALSIERNVYRPVPDRLYKNYTHLSPIAVESDISPIGGLIEVYRAMREHLLHNAALSGCTGEDALHGIAVIEFARRSAATGGRAERLDIPLAVA
jgi:predicted dehydrogenase